MRDGGVDMGLHEQYFGNFTKDKFLNGINYMILSEEHFRNNSVIQNFLKKTLIGSIVKAEKKGKNSVVVDIPYAAYTDPMVMRGVVDGTKLGYMDAIHMFQRAVDYKKQELEAYIRDELVAYKGESRGYINLALYTSKKSVDGFTGFELDKRALRGVLKSIYSIKNFSTTEQFMEEDGYVRVRVNAQLRVRNRPKSYQRV